jgi:hypothetical protein
MIEASLTVPIYPMTWEAQERLMKDPFIRRQMGIAKDGTRLN